MAEIDEIKDNIATIKLSVRMMLNQYGSCHAAECDLHGLWQGTFKKILDDGRLSEESHTAWACDLHLPYAREWYGGDWVEAKDAQAVRLLSKWVGWEPEQA